MGCVYWLLESSKQKAMIVRTRDIVMEMKSNNYQPFFDYPWKDCLQSLPIHFKEVAL